MIDIRFSECCDNCQHIDIDYETIQNVFGEKTTIIGCSHMCVCSRYHGEDAAEVSPPEIKGFYNAD